MIPCFFREIQAHISEDFWHIQVTHTGSDHKRCDFGWDRGRLFDHTAATLLYEMCVEEPQATVSKASTLPTLTLYFCKVHRISRKGLPLLHILSTKAYTALWPVKYFCH